jgi:hypothetical protein
MPKGRNPQGIGSVVVGRGGIKIIFFVLKRPASPPSLPRGGRSLKGFGRGGIIFLVDGAFC